MIRVSAEKENKEQTEIESTLNISNNDEITWSYDSQSDSWRMSVTCAVANPELPDYQGVSVNVPGAYVKGIDTDGDGTEDITGKTYSEEVTKVAAQTQTENGTATEATGTDISSWASYENGEVKFTLKDAASYRTKGASKATPGFDVMDYGQETYEFGSSTQDARHFDKYVLKVLQEDAEILSELFNFEEK